MYWRCCIKSLQRYNRCNKKQSIPRFNTSNNQQSNSWLLICWNDHLLVYQSQQLPLHTICVDLWPGQAHSFSNFTPKEDLQPDSINSLDTIYKVNPAFNLRGRCFPTGLLLQRSMRTCFNRRLGIRSSWVNSAKQAVLCRISIYRSCFVNSAKWLLHGRICWFGICSLDLPFDIQILNQQDKPNIGENYS